MRKQRSEINQLLQASLESKQDENLSASFVGFSAYATVDQEAIEGDIILFAGIEVNVGGGYDNDTSVFTCPQSGYYYVYFNTYIVRNLGDEPCLLSLRRDNTDIATVRSIKVVGVYSYVYWFSERRVVTNCLT